MKNFCAAPWVEGLLRSNGAFQTCCRNGTSFGNWQKKGLKKCWHSKLFQNFRKKITEGEFPDICCKACYANGTARSLIQELIDPFHLNKRIVSDFLNTTIPAVTNLENLFHLREADNGSEKALEEYFSTLDPLIKQTKPDKRFSIRSINNLFIPFIPGVKKQPAQPDPFPPEYRNALTKLNTIGLITKAYLEKKVTPPIIAPYRQVGLIYKCNARCIHCPGRYNNEITQGKMLEEKYLDAAFDFPEGIIDFFMHGSEFLFYWDWKNIALKLVQGGTKLTISTNGILLTEENIKFLIDNRIMKSLNISIDGGTKETVESIRRNVHFDKLMKSIEFLFHYEEEKKYEFILAFSFVLMKRNFHEFPKLIRLIHTLRKDRTLPFLGVNCQALENCGIQEYKDFVYKEHHSLIDRNELMETFKEVLKESQITGIPTNVFYSWKIEEFVEQGFPFPPLSM